MIGRGFLVGRRAARATATAAIGVTILDVIAVLLRAPWDPRVRSLAEQGAAVPPERFAFYAVGAIIWALIGVAFLARGGEGPLAHAPGWLVGGVCWYGVIASCLDLLTGLGSVAGWGFALLGVHVLFVGFGIVALRTNPSRLPPPREPERTAARGDGSPIP
jgi:hypothetical protein